MLEKTFCKAPWILAMVVQKTICWPNLGCALSQLRSLLQRTTVVTAHVISAIPLPLTSVTIDLHPLLAFLLSCQTTTKCHNSVKLPIRHTLHTITQSPCYTRPYLSALRWWYTTLKTLYKYQTLLLTCVVPIYSQHVWSLYIVNMWLLTNFEGRL